MEFDAELGQSAASLRALEQALADTEVAHQRASTQHALEIAAGAARLAESQRHAETQMTQAAAEAAAALEQEVARAARERESLERDRMAVESDLARQRSEYVELQRVLADTQASAQEALERLSREQTAERARFEMLVAEREKQLQDLEAQKQAADEAAATALAEVEHRFRLTLEAGQRDARTIEHLQEQLKTLGGQLDATRRQRDVLKTEADQVPPLLKQIDEIREENRRRFIHAPVMLFRCTRDGALSQVSQALASLLGYDSPAALQKLDFATTVFESGDELQWIIDRCLSSRSTESVETTWKKKNGSRVIVRLLAAAPTADSIDLAVQDITPLRVLEEKLHNSQRMEAVARYASEVAVTCHNVLRHVEQEELRWLARTDSDAARYHSELLLEEVTRAAKFLQQLAVYGHEQKNAPDLVDLNRVLRDLEPVLKRVAGSDIDLVLPKATKPLNLDVDAERVVERILVNVAAYGRQRMPLGGRLMFEVAPVNVDRKFVEKYPNVRPGAHVLLTVNEVKRALRPELLAAVQGQATGRDASASAHPGVDLGVLQALVSDCGGHLWMIAEPTGDMVLRIHLPRRVLDRPESPPAKRSDRERWVNQVAS
jgi:PAS domain S-box-containing protein